MKKGDRQEISNYRPLSILCCLSKILEKLIYVGTVSFLNKNSILIPTQYGFRNSHSTTHALLDVVNNAYNNINENNFTALIQGSYAVLKSMERYGIKFGQFPDWKRLEKKFFWFVSMEKEIIFPDLIYNIYQTTCLS